MILILYKLSVYVLYRTSTMLITNPAFIFTSARRSKKHLPTPAWVYLFIFFNLFDLQYYNLRRCNYNKDYII